MENRSITAKINNRFWTIQTFLFQFQKDVYASPILFNLYIGTLETFIDIQKAIETLIKKANDKYLYGHTEVKDRTKKKNHNRKSDKVEKIRK